MEWSKDRVIAAVTCLVGLIAALAAVFVVPEFRRAVGLDAPAPAIIIDNHPPARALPTGNGSHTPSPLPQRAKSTDTTRSAQPDPSESAPETTAAPIPRQPSGYRSEVQRVGPLEVVSVGCRPRELGLTCDALVTNRQSDRQYCLYNTDGDVMSRIVDNEGNVYTPREISLGEKRESGVAVVCTILPEGVPVRASVYYLNAPQKELVNLIDFTFDFSRSGGATALKSRFRRVPILQ